MSKAPLTSKAADQLRELLHQLKTKDRPQVIEAIAEARAHGDLSENAEYHAAREQQSFIEGRINALGTGLAEAQIIDITTINAEGRVVFGATVDLLNLDNEEAVTYQIVGELEADIELGLISITAPIARALIGKLQGDIAEVDAPSGVVEYEILEIRYI